MVDDCTQVIIEEDEIANMIEVEVIHEVLGSRNGR